MSDQTPEVEGEATEATIAVEVETTDAEIDGTELSAQE